MLFQATTANKETLETLNERCHHLLDLVINPLKSKNKSEISSEFEVIINRLERYGVAIVFNMSS